MIFTSGYNASKALYQKLKYSASGIPCSVAFERDQMIVITDTSKATMDMQVLIQKLTNELGGDWESINAQTIPTIAPRLANSGKLLAALQGNSASTEESYLNFDVDIVLDVLEKIDLELHESFSARFSKESRVSVHDLIESLRDPKITYDVASEVVLGVVSTEVNASQAIMDSVKILESISHTEAYDFRKGTLVRLLSEGELSGSQATVVSYDVDEAIITLMINEELVITADRSDVVKLHDTPTINEDDLNEDLTSLIQSEIKSPLKDVQDNIDSITDKAVAKIKAWAIANLKSETVLNNTLATKILNNTDTVVRQLIVSAIAKMNKVTQVDNI